LVIVEIQYTVGVKGVRKSKATSRKNLPRTDQMYLLEGPEGKRRGKLVCLREPVPNEKTK